MKKAFFARTISQKLFPALLALGLVILVSSPASAAEKARLMERWLVTDPLSTRSVDHRLWADLLQAYVVELPSGRTAFDYGAVTAEDKEKLDAYIAQLVRTDVDRLNRSEQLAFWINAFNALCVRFVLDNYPVKSISDVGGGFFSRGPWDERVFRVYSIDLSLNDIYHRILRPIWPDAVVHYGLSCAARGCPDIVAYPYTGPSVARALEAAARNYINRGAGVLVVRGETVRVSSLYSWYETDFGGADAGVIAHLRRYAEPALARQLADLREIEDDEYDWTLNGL